MAKIPHSFVNLALPMPKIAPKKREKLHFVCVRLCLRGMCGSVAIWMSFKFADGVYQKTCGPCRKCFGLWTLCCIWLSCEGHEDGEHRTVPYLVVEQTLKKSSEQMAELSRKVSAREASKTSKSKSGSGEKEKNNGKNTDLAGV